MEAIEAAEAFDKICLDSFASEATYDLNVKCKYYHEEGNQLSLKKPSDKNLAKLPTHNPSDAAAAGTRFRLIQFLLHFHAWSMTCNASI